MHTVKVVDGQRLETTDMHECECSGDQHKHRMGMLAMKSFCVMRSQSNMLMRSRVSYTQQREDTWINKRVWESDSKIRLKITSDGFPQLYH